MRPCDCIGRCTGGGLKVIGHVACKGLPMAMADKDALELLREGEQGFGRLLIATSDDKAVRDWQRRVRNYLRAEEAKNAEGQVVHAGADRATQTPSGVAHGLGSDSPVPSAPDVERDAACWKARKAALNEAYLLMRPIFLMMGNALDTIRADPSVAVPDASMQAEEKNRG